MGHRNSLTGWTVAVVQLGASLLAEVNYRRLPRAVAVPTSGQGRVAVIVPARNEAARLPALLRSLAALHYADREVIVVDDGSTDGTAEIAHAHGARVVTVTGPAPGWTGKSYACWIGAGETNAEWLLFTDADTVHEPDSLGTAIALTSSFDIEVLSFFTRQICVDFWERVLLPYAYFLYFVGAVAINRGPGSAVLNGQYILFRRETYLRIGEHAAVRSSLIEDVDIARLAARLGARALLVRGEDQVSVRMYDSLAGVREGFTKNAFHFVRISPVRGALTAIASVAFATSVPSALRGKSLPLASILALGPAAGLVTWQRRFGVSPVYSALYPLAAVVFQFIALDSMRRAITGKGAIWKDRRYT